MIRKIRLRAQEFSPPVQFHIFFIDLQCFSSQLKRPSTLLEQLLKKLLTGDVGAFPVCF